MARARTPRTIGTAAAGAVALACALIPLPGLADAPKPAGPSSSASSTSSASTASVPTGASSASTSASSVSPPPSPADVARERRERQARAVELHNDAKSLYERGLYRRAIAKLEAALALDPDGKELVYNLALIHEKLAEPDIAEAYYLRYLDMETDPKARERALAIVKRLKGAKKTIIADIEERAAPTAPTATASAAPSVAPSAARPTHVPSPMVFVIGGLAVAAVGVGIGFGTSAITSQPQNPTTGPTVSAYDLETRARSAHTQAVVADLSFAASIVMGAAATLLYFLEARSAQRPPPATLPSTATTTTAPPRVAQFRWEAPF